MIGEMTYNGHSLAIVLAVSPSTESVRVLSKALDGTVYVQTIGKPIKKYKVGIFCDSVSKKLAVEEAYNSGAVVSIKNNDYSFYGIIENEVGWNDYKDKFTANISVIVEAVE